MHKINGLTIKEAIENVIAMDKERVERKRAAGKEANEQKIGKQALAYIKALEEPETIDNKTAAAIYKYIICTAHTGKMSDLHSLSTCCLVNKYCLNRMKNESTICSHCFAVAHLEQYFNQYIKQVIASYFLSYKVWDNEVIPRTNLIFFRFESFGDLMPGMNGKVQFINYLNFAKKNRRSKFAIWTKNPSIMASVFETEKKPVNLSVVYSDPFINGTGKAPKNMYFIDHVFTVFDSEETAKNHGKAINCGARNCFDCGNCYNSSVYHINELLK